MCWLQLAFHPDPCSLPYMQKGTCDVTCNRCKPCPDPGGPNYCQANVQVCYFSQNHHADLQAQVSTSSGNKSTCEYMIYLQSY